MSVADPLRIPDLTPRQRCLLRDLADAGADGRTLVGLAKRTAWILYDRGLLATTAQGRWVIAPAGRDALVATDHPERSA